MTLLNNILSVLKARKHGDLLIESLPGHKRRVVLTIIKTPTSYEANQSENITSEN